MSRASATRKDSGLVALSEAAYRLLLVAYPARFRGEYGPHTAQAFRDCCLRALILGAAALLLASVAAAAVSPASSPYDARYRPTDPFFQMVQVILFPTAVALVTTGIAGLYARYASESRRLGRLGLILGMVGGAITFGLMLGLFIIDSGDPLWSAMMFSIAGMFGGLALFGIDALRSRALPRGNYLPVLAGTSFPAVVIASLAHEAVTGRWLEMSDLVTALVFLVTGLALLALGQVLRGEAVEAAAPAR